MKLDNLEALLAAATVTPWTSSDVECRTHEDDAAIVALMNAAPALLRVAKAARAWRDSGWTSRTAAELGLIAAIKALEADDG